MTVELLIDAGLAVLLLVTIGYAIVLNQKLNQFRNLREEMQAMVGDFARATRDAEEGIASLQERSQTLGSDLETHVSAVEGRVSEARSLADDLVFLVEKGTSVADRLETAVSKGLSAGPQTEEGDVQSGKVEPLNKKRAAGGGAAREKKQQAGKPDGFASPEARELLKTLDGIR